MAVRLQRQRAPGLSRELYAADFAQAVRERRLALGLTQQEVAERAGVSEPMIAHYEAETAMPTFERLVELAATLGIDPLRLAPGLRHVGWQPDPDPEVTALVRQVRRLPKRHRSIAASILKAIAAEK